MTVKFRLHGKDGQKEDRDYPSIQKSMDDLAAKHKSGDAGKYDKVEILRDGEK